jgi:hypothetical protein
MGPSTKQILSPWLGMDFANIDESRFDISGGVSPCFERLKSVPGDCCQDLSDCLEIISVEREPVLGG